MWNMLHIRHICLKNLGFAEVRAEKKLLPHNFFWKRACIEARGDGEPRQASDYKRVAVELPLGSAQIEYFARCDQWVPRGSVLRCLIREDLHSRLLIRVDERDLQLKQFGKLLATYEGWGMRIEFVPQEEVHRPVVEIREPTAE
jgi:hypothetical protein